MIWGVLLPGDVTGDSGFSNGSGTPAESFRYEVSMSLDGSVVSASASKVSLSDSAGSAQGLYCAAGALVTVLHLLLDDETARTGFGAGAAGFAAGVRDELDRRLVFDVEFRKDGARPLVVPAEGLSWPREVDARSFGFWMSLPLDASPARLSRDGLGRSDDVEVVAGDGGAGWTIPETGRGSREGRGMPLIRLWEVSILT